jgi:hypothetical protein
MSGPNHHNDGQKNGAENHYEPPHQQSVLGELLFGYSKEELECRADYNKCWNNGHKSS